MQISSTQRGTSARIRKVENCIKESASTTHDELQTVAAAVQKSATATDFGFMSIHSALESVAHSLQSEQSPMNDRLSSSGSPSSIASQAIEASSSTTQVQHAPQVVQQYSAQAHGSGAVSRQRRRLLGKKVQSYLKKTGPQPPRDSFYGDNPGAKERRHTT